MPAVGWNGGGEVVISTCPDHPEGTAADPGTSLLLSGRTVVVLREG